jgi:hypothetical protein
VAAADGGGVRGFFRKLGARLGGGFLGGLLGRKIDAELLEELESRLLTADVGVAATQALLGDLHKQVARNELKDEAALLQALRVRMLALLSGTAKPLVLDPTRQCGVGGRREWLGQDHHHRQVSPALRPRRPQGDASRR